jgi:hypothetical protein
MSQFGMGPRSCLQQSPRVWEVACVHPSEQAQGLLGFVAEIVPAQSSVQEDVHSAGELDSPLGGGRRLDVSAVGLDGEEVRDVEEVSSGSDVAVPTKGRSQK